MPNPTILFERYTDIENLRHFPDVIQADEEVIVTEAARYNVRIGAIARTILAGSHGLPRKRLKARRPRHPHPCGSQPLWSRLWPC